MQIGTKRSGEPAFHELDGVSEDGSIVVAIKASGGSTSENKEPTGPVKAAYSDALFLSLAPAQRRVLAFTERRFFEVFSNVSDGKLPVGVERLHVELPVKILEKVRVARRRASDEVPIRERSRS